MKSPDVWTVDTIYAYGVAAYENYIAQDITSDQFHNALRHIAPMLDSDPKETMMMMMHDHRNATHH